MAKLLVRSGLVFGAVYYSRQLGVWGDQQQTERLYNGIKNSLHPHLVTMERKLPFEVPALPPKGEVRYLVKHYYNEGVKSTFHFILMLPCYAGQLMKKTKDTVTELLDKTAAPQEISKPERDEPKRK